MATSGERRALIFLASLAAIGVTARACRDDRKAQVPVIAAGGAELAQQIEAVDSAIATGGAKRVRRRRSADSAGTAGTAPRGARAPGRRGALPPQPGAGPADGASVGSRVSRRAGPAIVGDDASDQRAAYRRRVAFEDSARDQANEKRSRADAVALAGRRARERAARAQLDSFTAGQAPDRADALAPGARPGRRPLPARPPLDLDVAPVQEIERLPSVDPELARRIVNDRAERGPFGSLDGLRRVPGVGAALARRLQKDVTFSLTPRLGSAGETYVFRTRRRSRGAARP